MAMSKRLISLDDETWDFYDKMGRFQGFGNGGRMKLIRNVLETYKGKVMSQLSGNIRGYGFSKNFDKIKELSQKDVVVRDVEEIIESEKLE